MAAKVPIEEMDFRTKDSIALDQVRRARGLGVKFGWVLADAGYGKGPDFLFALHEMGERFLVDVHKDFIVFKAPPRPHIPRRTSAKGRAPSRAKISAIPIEVQALVAIPGFYIHQHHRKSLVLLDLRHENQKARLSFRKAGPL